MRSYERTIDKQLDNAEDLIGYAYSAVTTAVNFDKIIDSTDDLFKNSKVAKIAFKNSLGVAVSISINLLKEEGEKDLKSAIIPAVAGYILPQKIIQKNLFKTEHNIYII